MTNDYMHIQKAFESKVADLVGTTKILLALKSSSKTNVAAVARL